jgi:hypothetical protein
MTGTHRTSKVTVGVEPWDTEWATERAAEALRYLGTHYPECLDALRVLDAHEKAAHEAALHRRPGGLSRSSQGLHEGRKGRGPRDTAGCGMSRKVG